MNDFKRRDFLKTAAGVAAGTALGAGPPLLPPEVAAPQYKVPPEQGAKLTALRWKRFCPGEGERRGVMKQNRREEQGWYTA